MIMCIYNVNFLGVCIKKGEKSIDNFHTYEISTSLGNDI